MNDWSVVSLVGAYHLSSRPILIQFDLRSFLDSVSLTHNLGKCLFFKDVKLYLSVSSFMILIKYCSNIAHTKRISHNLSINVSSELFVKPKYP